MLFCCLWRNVETCHKHFVVVSRHQQTPTLTISDKCRNLRRSGGVVLITPSRSQRWQHARKLDIGSESQFLPTTPAFDAAVRGGGSRRNIAMMFGTEKLEWCGYQTVKTFWRYLYLFWQNVYERDRRTDNTAWRHRPRLHSIARQKYCLGDKS